MKKLQNVLGVIGGIALVLSSAAHSLLGWPRLRSQLGQAGLSSDLTFSVQVGWQFGGLAMLAFGIIVVVLFVRQLRGEKVPANPAAIVSIAYLAFGCWALLASSFNPFFLVFVVPGLLLAFAAWRGRSQGEGTQR